MNNEREFYRQLAEVPEVPPDIFDGVTRAVRRRSIIRTTLLSMAASIVVVAGGATLFFNSFTVNNQLRPEVATELQTVREFLNGSDLESDLELYAVVEGY